MAGTASSDSTGCALSVDVVLFPKRVEKTPRGTDCLVVVAGVNGCGCGSALDSVMPEPCRSWFGGGAAVCEGEDAFMGRDSGIVDFGLHLLQVNALQGRYATPSGLLAVSCSVEKDALADGAWRAPCPTTDPASTIGQSSHRQHTDTFTSTRVVRDCWCF